VAEPHPRQTVLRIQKTTNSSNWNCKGVQSSNVKIMHHVPRYIINQLQISSNQWTAEYRQQRTNQYAEIQEIDHVHGELMNKPGLVPDSYPRPVHRGLLHLLQPRRHDWFSLSALPLSSCWRCRPDLPPDSCSCCSPTGPPTTSQTNSALPSESFR
jgi:hypothetical protein